jgi:hypothetical protein
MTRPVLRSLFALAVALAASVGLAQAVLPREVRQEILRSVVQVQAYDIEADRIIGTGSGSIVSPDGFVLTNYHVVEGPSGRPLEWHAILVSDPEAPDLLPEFRYWARYVAGDATYDLAILRIVEYADETPVPAGTTFPFVTLGDSGNLLPGDPITVVGYPGISGDTITFTTGVVSGFLGEDLTAGGKQWIKTDAKLARGNSGGAAFDENGLLIGIPTLRTQTTDGSYIEQQDYLRPLALALPLIQAHVPNVARVGGLGASVAGVGGAGAAGGLRTEDPSRPSADASTPVGQAQVELGSLGADDQALDSGEYVDAFLVAMTAGTPVQISVTSQAIDPYLLILDPDDELMLEVDDSSGAGLNVRETFTPAVTGEHLVVVTSAFAAEVGAYELRIEGAEIVSGDLLRAEGAAASDPTPSGDDGFAAPVTVGVASGFAGELRPGQVTTAELGGAEGAWAFHTYRIDVAPGTSTLTIRLQADADLDLFLKFGSEIATYAEDGDWQYRDIEVTNDATLSLRAPQAGTWFVDVAWAVGDPSARSRYELSVE